jgi:hypothetical protein
MTDTMTQPTSDSQPTPRSALVVIDEAIKWYLRSPQAHARAVVA